MSNTSVEPVTLLAALDELICHTPELVIERQVKLGPLVAVRLPIENTSPATFKNFGFTTTKISVVKLNPVPTRGPRALPGPPDAV